MRVGIADALQSHRDSGEVYLPCRRRGFPLERVTLPETLTRGASRTEHHPQKVEYTRLGAMLCSRGGSSHRYEDGERVVIYESWISFIGLLAQLLSGIQRGRQQLCGRSPPWTPRDSFCTSARFHAWRTVRLNLGLRSPRSAEDRYSEVLNKSHFIAARNFFPRSFVYYHAHMVATRDAEAGLDSGR